MSQLVIVLLSFPFAPVVVLNRTTPLVVDVLTPVSVQNLTVLELASLMKRTATPDVDVFAIVRPFVPPVPPGWPSNVRFEVPFRSTVAVVLELVIVRGDAPLAGRTVTVFVPLLPGRVPGAIGKVSLVLTYVFCSSRTVAPAIPFAFRFANAAVSVAKSHPAGHTVLVPLTVGVVEVSEIPSTDTAAFGDTPSVFHENTRRCVVPAALEGTLKVAVAYVVPESRVVPICPLTSCVPATGVVEVGTRNTFRRSN